jgi:hypothetical protein
VVFVLYFSFGVSKWDKVELDFFVLLVLDWKGVSLVDVASVVNLTSSTTTIAMSVGLFVVC